MYIYQISYFKIRTSFEFFSKQQVHASSKLHLFSFRKYMFICFLSFIYFATVAYECLIEYEIYILKLIRSCYRFSHIQVVLKIGEIVVPLDKE